MSNDLKVAGEDGACQVGEAGGGQFLNVVWIDLIWDLLKRKMMINQWIYGVPDFSTNLCEVDRVGGVFSPGVWHVMSIKSLGKSWFSSGTPLTQWILGGIVLGDPSDDLCGAESKLKTHHLAPSGYGWNLPFRWHCLLVTPKHAKTSVSWA